MGTDALAGVAMKDNIYQKLLFEKLSELVGKPFVPWWK